MIRKDWKKQLKRVRDIADKNFTRNEKPEQLSESLIKLEQRIDSLKSVCQAVGKKLLACLQLHGVERDKRLKKLPESALSKQLIESSGAFDDKEAAFSQTLLMCGNVEGELASMLVNYEDNVELSVLQPLQTLLERDIPAIMKLRKQVAKQAQEVESLKSRYSARQTVLMDRPGEGNKRANQALEEMEEAVNKLELYKDQLATEIFNFYAREGELSKIFTYLIESQLKYHSDATVALQKVLPEIQSIEKIARRPVFGCSLEDHLRLTNQPIATVISESIKALLEEGLDQEGLFRIAGGATKLKKLKAAFDAGMVDMDEYMTDPHCVASALKLYLRELPEPLLTFDLYDDWAEASQLPPDQRLNAIASILTKMKMKGPYFNNLKYLIQFLARLADNAEVNKMSPTNLAIVVGPNLLWSRNGDGQNILTTGVQSSIAEAMISNAALLFGDDSELGEMTSQVVLPSQPPGGSSTTHSRDVNSSVAMKQTIAKVDSSDSLSSDSLGADSAVVTNQTSVSGSEVSSMSKSVETSDASNLVAPKRVGRKTQAPLPPSTEANAQVAKVTTTSVTKASATSGNHDTPTIHQKVTMTTTQTTVVTATEEMSGDSAEKSKTSTRVAVTTTQAKVSVAAEETVPLQKSPAPLRSDPVVTTTGDEKTQPVGVKRSTQFAASQAMISNILSGPRKTLLTRPNTVYMENAKVELLKTAEEQNEDETTPSNFDVNGAGNSHGKTGEGIHADSSTATQKSKPPSIAEEGGSKKSAKKAEPSVDEMFAVTEEIGNLDSDEEIKAPSSRDSRRSEGGDMIEVPRKPERPSKPVRVSQPDAEGGNRSSSGTKVSTEDHSRKETSVAESRSAAKPHSESTASAGTQSSNTAKHPKHPPPEAPHVVPQQPASGGSGVRPPKPPPPSVAIGSRLSSDTAIEEDTYL